jgi:putative copper export protein
MLSPTLDTWRLVLHVLAAAVWVGGQLTLAGLVPTVRANAPDATKAVARAFARVAWPAFAVLVVTGIWNLTDVNVSDTSTEYQVTVFVKVLLAAASGVATAVHQFGRTRLALAVGGAAGLLTSLGALFLGVLLRSGT